MSSNNTIRTCWHLENVPLNERSTRFYVKPATDWLAIEWWKFKLSLNNFVFIKARELLEEIQFDAPERLLILQMMDETIGLMKEKLRIHITERKKLARKDSSNRIGKKTDDLEVLLSQEGLEEVVSELDAQMDQFESTSRNTKKRIDNVLQARYGNPALLSLQVSHTLRIDKTNLVIDNANKIDEVATSYRLGYITSERFFEKILERLEIGYRRTFRAGKGTSLSESDLEFINNQIISQTEYLDNLVRSSEIEKASSGVVSRRVNQRASLFAKRAAALYEAGWLTNLPDDTLVNWVLGMAEHCETCPAYSRNSPYLKETLPGLPAEGFSVTQCGTNCRCHLEMNELSTAEMEVLA